MNFLQATAKLYATVRGAKHPNKADKEKAEQLVNRINTKRINANLKPFT